MLWLTSIIVGLYAVAAVAEYLIALHAASGVRLLHVRPQGTRERLS